MAQNSYADISAFVNPIFEDALFIARDNNIMTNLVTIFNDRTGLALRKSSEYTSATMNTVAETDDMIGQAFTPANLATLTPTERGAQFFLTDSRMESDPFDVRTDAAMELGLSLGTKLETDLTGTFSSLTGGTIGASGTLFSWSYFYAMLTNLRRQKAPFPYYWVGSAAQYHQLGKAASVAGGAQTNAPQFQDEIMNMFYVGQVGPVLMYVSENVTTSGTDAYNAMFSRAAIGLDMRRQPRLEPERDASRRGWELNLTAVYAAGVWRPKFGVQGIFDNQAPTS